MNKTAEILDIIISNLIEVLKQCTYIETNEYKIKLQNEKEDTTIGKTYQISIITEYKGYEVGVDKE